MPGSNTPTLLTVRQFSEKHPAFSEGALRWMIFKAGGSQTCSTDEHAIALNKAIVRLGRRVLINEAKFFQWAEAGSNASP